MKTLSGSFTQWIATFPSSPAGKTYSGKTVRVGEEFSLAEGGCSHFGSGGGWGWIKYADGGAEPRRIGTVPNSEEDNGFIATTGGRYVFDAPGLVAAAQGDSINGGRTFFRTAVMATAG